MNTYKPNLEAVFIVLALLSSLFLPLKASASEADQTVSDDIASRLADNQAYPKFNVPADYTGSDLPGVRYTAKNGTFVVTVNNVPITVVYSLPMEGIRLAPSAGNLVFYGPYPDEKTKLDSNIVPDIVTKLGCSVFSFQIDGLGQAVSQTPYWLEPAWFDGALLARDIIAKKYNLERKKLILLGYSGGGGMVMNFAGRYPEQIDTVAAQAPNVVPAYPPKSKINWLMVVNRGDNNRSVMKPFYAQLRKGGANALYCETTPERSRGQYHAPSGQTLGLIYDYLAGILDQRRLNDKGITDVSRLWPYAAPATPLNRYAIVKTVHLSPEDFDSSKFDFMPSLAFTLDWSQVCPPEQNLILTGTHVKLILNFPARAVPAGVILYYDKPSFADVPREVEDINSLAEHGYLVVSSMTAGPEDFVNAATLWIKSQSRLNGLHIHLVGNGLPGAQFISHAAGKNNLSFRSLCLIDFKGSSFDSDCLENLTLAAKECGMYGFYTYSGSNETADLSNWASDLVDRGAQNRGCFNLRFKPEETANIPEPQLHTQAEIQALSMVETLIAKADLP